MSDGAGDVLAALTALAGLSGMGPRRLAAVLAEWPPVAAWEAIAAGRLRLRSDGGTAFPGQTLVRLGRQWVEEAGRRRPDQLVGRCQALGIEVLPYGAPGYPERLLTDSEPPLILFAQGDLSVLDAPCAAVVGTRRASAYGLEAAVELAGDLAEAGVAVVSGLAVGIDAAAHRGALGVAGGRAVGVVGSGLDVVYPGRHRALWCEVARRGLLLSEAPPGTKPEPWRFPARNRVIAGLSQVVIVVESPAEGGSMITAKEAADRELPVMAVPGSIRSPLSEGANTLIFNGGTPVRSADDVLALLGWPGGTGSGFRPARARAPVDRPPPAERPDRRGRPELPPTSVAAVSGPGATGPEQAVLDALGWEPATLDDLARRTRLEVPALVLTVESLVRQGAVQRQVGGFQRRRQPARRGGRP